MGERRQVKKARKRAEELAHDIARGDTNTALGKMLDDINNDRSELPPTTDSLRKIFDVPDKRRK